MEPSPSDSSPDDAVFVRHTGGFVTLPNETVNDERLSLRALGLLTKMLGKPPGWRFNADRMAAGLKEGRDAVRTTMGELEAGGYVRRTRRRRQDGTFQTVVEVASRPDLMPPLPGATATDYQASVDQASVDQASVGQASLSILRSNTERTAAPRRRAAAQEVPGGWTPSAEGVAYAVGKGMQQASVAGEAEKFVSYHRSKGNTFRRVDAAWQTWVRNWADRQPKAAPAPRRTAGRTVPGAWR
jgi:hypothetical protein